MPPTCARPWPLLVLGASALFATAGCGHARATPPFRVLEASGDAGLRLLVVGQDQREDRLTLTVRLDNAGDHVVEVRNPTSARVEGFALAAGGHDPIGADASTASRGHAQAAQLRELPPGTETELQVRWTFSPPLRHARYPWTLTVGNLAIGDRRLGALQVQWSPATTE